MSVNAEGFVVCDRCNQVDEEGTKWDKKKKVHLCDGCLKEIMDKRTRRLQDDAKRHQIERQEVTSVPNTTRDRALKAKDNPSFEPGRKRTNKANVGRRFGGPRKTS